MQLNNINYYSDEANKEYLSVSQFKDFVGTIAYNGCEAKALQKIEGLYVEEPTKSMLQGSYIDACFEGTIETFKEHNPSMFTLKGELKAEFKQAQSAFERTQRDELFKQYMSGQKQVIFTAELWGAKWKCKLDSYIEDKCIVDLKYIKDIHERIWVKDFGFVNFIEAWGYDLQLAIYQKIVEANIGKLLPCYIAAVDKKTTPEIEIIQILQNKLDYALEGIEQKVKRVLDLKAGLVKPDRCEKCDFCLDTKILTSPISSDLLIEI